MTEEQARQLLQNPVQLHHWLNVRLVQLAGEDSNTAIRAIELLRATALELGEGDQVLAGLSTVELQELEDRVTGWLREQS